MRQKRNSLVAGLVKHGTWLMVFISLAVLVGLRHSQTLLGESATARLQPHLQIDSSDGTGAQESKSAEAKNAEAKITETKNAEAKITETKITETKNAEAKTADGSTVDSSPSPVGLSYETLTLPKSIVHIVRIPAQSSMVIRPAIATEGLERLDDLAQTSGAIAAINGGFFDPNNGLTTSYVIVDGEAVLNPLNNDGLMSNFNVAIYIDRILNRSEFRRYQCNTVDGPTVDYAITPRDQLIPFDCELVDALGAGPALLPQFRGEDEAFVDASNGRDALGSNSPNARSAIGLTADGTVLLVMAAQRADVSDRSGLSLFDLADVMASLGVEHALNLDGGSSSSLYYEGTTHYGRLDADKQVIQRSVKSVLLVLPADS